MSTNGGLTQQINVAGVAISIRELTVLDIRQNLEQRCAGAIDASINGLMENMAIGDIYLSDILLMTDLTHQKIAPLTPSNLQEIAESCTELNAAFFDLVMLVDKASSMTLNS